MIRIQQWQGERAGLNTAKIYRDKAESSAAYGGQHLRSQRINYRPHQVRRRQLHPRDLVVVAHSEIGESQLPQGGLGAFNLAELCRRNRMMVGNPRRQARRSRLVGYLQAYGPCNRTHITLGHAGLGEGPQHIVIRGRTRPWSVGSSGIIGVFPICDGVKSIPVCHLILDPAEQLVLAKETTIRSVRLILGAITFVRFDFNERDAHLARNIMGRCPFLGSKTW
jgi:hypothetical protein